MSADIHVTYYPEKWQAYSSMKEPGWYRWTKMKTPELRDGDRVVPWYTAKGPFASESEALSVPGGSGASSGGGVGNVLGASQIDGTVVRGP